MEVDITEFEVFTHGTLNAKNSVMVPWKISLLLGQRWAYLYRRKSTKSHQPPYLLPSNPYRLPPIYILLQRRIIPLDGPTYTDLCN